MIITKDYEKIGFDIGVDLCLCGSGRITKDCCLRNDGRLIPKRVVTHGYEGAPEYQNPKCYAAPLGGCSKKVTGEHFLSKGILEIIQSNGPLITYGAPWMKPGEGQQLGIKSQTANVLCNCHNSGLSGLDAIGIKFFDAFITMNKSMQNASPGAVNHEACLFNGHDIERWALKTLCGMVFSGNSSNIHGVVRNWKPPLQWLRILYGLEDMPDGWGIYALIKQHNDEVMAKAAIMPIGAGDIALGIQIDFCDMDFVLWMTSDRSVHEINHDGFRLLYRHGGYHFHKGNNHSYIIVEWEDNLAHPGIVMNAGGPSKPFDAEKFARDGAA